jgi:hypothetical protein
MNGYRLFCLAAIGATCMGVAGPAAALDGRHQVGSVVRTVGVPVATTTTAQVLYVVPVVPTLLGIRPAPVGQPLVYVIESPEDAPNHRHIPSSGRALERGQGAGIPEAAANGPRVITID